MDKFENYIKAEFENMKLPDVDMVKLVETQINSEIKNDIEKKEVYKTIVYKSTKMSGKVSRIRKAVAVFIIMLLTIGLSTGVYAAVNGMSMSEVCISLWNNIIGGRVIEQISCDAVVDYENNSFGNISIEPFKVIGDENGIYIILKLKSNGDIKLNDKMVFREYSMKYLGDADAALEMYSLGLKDDVLYVALEYIGGSDEIAKAGKITLELKNLFQYDNINDEKVAELDDDEIDKAEEAKRTVSRGYYKANISYNYISSVRNIISEKKTFITSNLTIKYKTRNKKDYINMLNKKLCVVMKDGKIIYSYVDFGIEDEDSNMIIYKLSEPIDINNIIRIFSETSW